MRATRSICLVAAVALSLLAGPSAAPASTTIGSDLASAGTTNSNCASPVDYVQTALPGATLLAPASGVITEWRVRDSGGTLALRVTHEVTGATYDFLRTSSAQTGSGLGSGEQVFATRLAVTAGDAIAIACSGNPGIGIITGLGASYGYDSFFPTAADGTDSTGGTGTGAEFLFNASIEADADGDGFGDQTQDFCDVEAATQGPCPAPASVSFGAQTLGTHSPPRTVTLSNTSSDTPLPVTSISAGGDFALASDGCGASIAPGGSCTVGVVFAPSAPGARTGNLSIADPASGSPQTVSLGGTGKPSGDRAAALKKCHKKHGKKRKRCRKKADRQPV